MDNKEKLENIFMKVIEMLREDEETIDEELATSSVAYLETEKEIKKYIEEFKQILNEL